MRKCRNKWENVENVGKCEKHVEKVRKSGEKVENVEKSGLRRFVTPYGLKVFRVLFQSRFGRLTLAISRSFLQSGFLSFRNISEGHPTVLSTTSAFEILLRSEI